MSLITMLGVDPSLSSTGWAVAEVDTRTCQILRVIDMGTIITAPTKVKQVRKSSDDLARSVTVASTLRGIVQKHAIKVGASEVPSGAQDAKASRAFGIVVGILGSLIAAGCPLIEVTPTEVKLASYGTKTADKEDIVRWAVEKTAGDEVAWNTSKTPNDWAIPHGDGYVTKTMEHQADAIAAIEAAITSQQFRQLAGMLASLI